jgi:hypothetical protein
LFYFLHVEEWWRVQRNIAFRMIASLLQDVAIRSHLLVQQRLEIPSTAVSSSQQPLASSTCSVTSPPHVVANLLIDFDSIIPSSIPAVDPSCTLETVDKFLAGLVARQWYLTATIYWSGTPSSATDRQEQYLHPCIEQTTLGLIRAYLPKFRKDAVALVVTSDAAHLAAMIDAIESPLHNKHNTLLCSTRSDVLHSGAQVCRNIDRFLIDGTDLEIFVPERLISLCPAFKAKANLRHIIPQAEFLLQRGFKMGTPRSDEPLALHTYQQCEQRLQSDPIAAVLWMLQRISYASEIPILIGSVAGRLFPGIASLDQVTQEKWLDLANQDCLSPVRKKKLLSSGMEELGVIHTAVQQCCIGPWCAPQTLTFTDIGVGFTERLRWWSRMQSTDSWFNALAPMRGVIDSILTPHHSATTEVGGVDEVIRPSAFSTSSLWPKIQRNVDPFALWKMLAIRVPTQREDGPALFRVAAPLAADLAAPGVLHPAIYLTFALVAGSMQLYEWEWVALLTCCCANATTAISPLFRCSRAGLESAINGFLSVYEHVCRLNEACNGAFFPVVCLPKLPPNAGAMVGTSIPSMVMFRHIMTAFSDEAIDRRQAHEQYAAVVRDHGTCCAFANPSHTPHLSIYHRVLVTALRQ